MEDVNYDHIFQIEQDNWWYKSKRDLWDRILKKTNKRFSSALDIGCGVGSNLKILEKYSQNVQGIDYSEKAIDYCRKKKYQHVSIGDVHHLNINNKYDLILCSDILEHVDDNKAMQEISKVLKSGGWLIFSVPAHKYLWNDNDDLSQHQRRYEKKELIKLLSKEFKIIKLSYWNFSLFFPTYLIYQLQKLKKNRTKTNNLNLIPKWMNTILYFILKIENRLFQKINLPQGISLVGIAIKK